MLGLPNRFRQQLHYGGLVRDGWIVLRIVSNSRTSDNVATSETAPESCILYRPRDASPEPREIAGPIYHLDCLGLRFSCGPCG